MRIAALYDIHANLPALEAVLQEIGDVGVDMIVVGGDVVPGPMPRETIAALLALPGPVQFIQGNGERDVMTMAAGVDTHTVPEQARDIVRWTSDVLSPADLSWFEEWPQTVRIVIPGVGDVLFCHATPRSDREIFTVRTPEQPLLPIFDAAAAAVVICGHTHMQFDRKVGQTRVANAGSVGMPFGNPGAYWALLGTDVELRRTTYDLTAAADRIRASDYPHASEFAAGNVERPPAEGTMLELFEGAGLR
jgi:predicted phosphodiesterase